MSFETLSQRVLKRKNEQYILQEKKQYTEYTEEQVIKDEVGNVIKKDPVGNIKEDWVDLQELQGVIQHRQREDISNAGQESMLRYRQQGYIGYFNPTFDLETDKLANYRIKFIRKYETIYLRIYEYDPNNYLRGIQHHIAVGLIEDKKHPGR